MLSSLRPALVLLALFTVLTGILYPLAVTGIAKVAFSDQANGSLVKHGETVIGSSLIGQAFTSDRYFHGRPSAAGANGYDAAGSSGSNLGPTSQKLVDRVRADVDRLKAESGAATVPADAVTTSASGLDPDISPAFAMLQVKRVAAGRGVAEDKVKALIDSQIEGRTLGVLGEPRVNVLLLNMALDALPSS